MSRLDEQLARAGRAGAALADDDEVAEGRVIQLAGDRSQLVERNVDGAVDVAGGELSGRPHIQEADRVAGAETAAQLGRVDAGRGALALGDRLGHAGNLPDGSREEDFGPYIYGQYVRTFRFSQGVWREPHGECIVRTTTCRERRAVAPMCGHRQELGSAE